MSAPDSAFGHRFADPDLLRAALTHPSAADRGTALAFERLEFLGDRVLGLIVARLLHDRFPNEPEGALALRFAGLVRRETLAEVATDCGLVDRIRLGPGGAGGGQGLVVVLSDACEALIGALYLDGGLAAATTFVVAALGDRVDRDPLPPKDAKTALQEWAMARGLPLPQYTVLAQTGPSHRPDFTIAVEVGGVRATGTGSAKRNAERAAAVALLERLEAGATRDDA